MRKRKFIERMKNSLLGGFYAVMMLILTEKSGPIYGYKLMKMLHEKSSGFFNPSESTIYTILKNLEREGIVRSFWALAGEQIPRKYYELSDEGKKVLRELMDYVEKFFEALEKIIKV